MQMFMSLVASLLNRLSICLKLTPVETASRIHQEFLIWKQFVESSAQWSYTKQSFDSFERVRPHFEALAKRLLQIIIQNSPSPK